MKRYLRHLPALLGVVLLIGAIYVVQREFRHLKLSDIKLSLAAIPQLIIRFSNKPKSSIANPSASCVTRLPGSARTRLA